MSTDLNDRVKFDAHAALRQRFWRSYLHEYDADKSGLYSVDELDKVVESIGLHVTRDMMKQFFLASGKDIEREELTLEEAMRCLEGEFGESPSGSTGSMKSVTKLPRKTALSIFGHTPESLGNLRLHLEKLFAVHPMVYKNNWGVLTIPPTGLSSLFKSFGDAHGVALLEEKDEADLVDPTKTDPQTEITPDFLVNLAERISESPLDIGDRAQTPTKDLPSSILPGFARSPLPTIQNGTRTSHFDLPDSSETPRPSSPAGVRRRNISPSRWNVQAIPPYAGERRNGHVNGLSLADLKVWSYSPPFVLCKS